MDPQSYIQLKQDIADRLAADSVLLEQIRSEIRPLRSEVRRIFPRATTAMSLVAADGGNNSLRFDPFLVHVVRIVDSSNREYCLEALTPTTSISELSERQFNIDGSPRTRLGEMMAYLGVKDLTKLSPMIRSDSGDQATSLDWIKAYRELVEWAALFSIIRQQDFGSDILIVRDGLLRSKVFAGDLFHRYLQGIQESIEAQRRKNRRRIYLASVAKHSQVLTRYRLAMALEGILTTHYPAYLPIPRITEVNAYTWSEFATREDRFVGGKMFFVKFGSNPRDPIWAVDIFLPQESEAAQILGYMLADANNGFPIPLYPQCLQKAHENAALIDFDFDIFQNYIFDGIRRVLGERAAVLDIFRLQDSDPAQRRYE
jgi:hypothetical protein